MAQVNVADIAASTQGSLAASMAGLDQLYSQMGVENARRESINSSAADAQELVTSTASLAEAQAQSQALKYATLLGTNPEASTEQLSSLITDKNALFNKARKDLQQFHKNQQVGLFTDGPMAWLQAQVSQQGISQDYNAAVEEHNLVGKRIDDLVSTTGELDKMTLSIAQTKTTESAKAEATVARSKLDDLQSQIRLDGLKTNAQGIVQVQAMKQGMFDNTLRIRGQQMEEARLGLAVQSAKLQQASLSLAIEERNDRLATKQENADEKATAVSAINLYRKSNGMPEISQVELGLLSKDPQQKALVDQQLIGGLTIAQSGKRYLADSPSNALAISAINNAVLPAGPQKLIDITKQTVSGIEADMQSKTNPIKVKTRGEFESLLNSRVQDKAAKDAKLITNDSGNIYSPPALAVLAADPELGKLKAIQTVVAPLVSSGVKDFNPIQIAPLIMESAKKGEISLTDAIAGITALGNKSIAYNNEYYSYKTTLGIPDQKAFPVKLETTGSFRAGVNAFTGGNEYLKGIPFIGPSLQGTAALFGGTNTELIDISNPAQVASYANRYMAGEISANLKAQAAKTGKNGK